MFNIGLIVTSTIAATVLAQQQEPGCHVSAIPQGFEPIDQQLSREFSVGTKVPLKCSSTSNTSPNGTPEATCVRGGVWTVNNECVGGCKIHTIGSEYVVQAGNTMPAGSRVVFQCSPNYYMRNGQNQGTATCSTDGNGRWNFSGQCQPIPPMRNLITPELAVTPSPEYSDGEKVGIVVGALALAFALAMVIAFFFLCFCPACGEFYNNSP